LAALARAQENGAEYEKGIEQVIRSQRLPVREARMLRRALAHPREVEQIAPALHSDALRRFGLTQVLLAALVDRNFEAGEVASVGTSLTAAEKAKVREQLIDLAKTIPALAIFAAPGGMLLLPILIKLLPFNLLPSSFIDRPPAVAALPEPQRKSGS